MNRMGIPVENEIGRALQRVVDLRRHLHALPELSFEEKESAAYIQSLLREIGVTIKPFPEHHSFAAVIDSGNTGPTMGLRAELDALPIAEETNLPFASKAQGVMHACGHDIHMALAVGVAWVLRSLKNLWRGKVVLIFESGEEMLPGGAAAIVRSELFAALNIDTMVAAHVLPELPVGKFGFCSGSYMASGDEVYLTVKGKGGHAALPHTLIDPVLIASDIILSLQSLVSRKAPASVPTVLSFGRVTAQGATNIIPDEVSIEGTFRTMDEQWREKAHGEITAIASGLARSFGGACEVTIKKGYPVLHNDPALTSRAVAAVRDILSPDSVLSLSPRMTTDDFARFSQVVPSLFFRIGVGNPGNPTALHRSDFAPDEQAIPYALKALIAIILDFLR